VEAPPTVADPPAACTVPELDEPEPEVDEPEPDEPEPDEPAPGEKGIAGLGAS
jgi:hypothetical protein